MTPGVPSVLGTVVAWMLAHNILYTYIAPFAARAGLGAHVDAVLLVFGAAALAGIWLAGRLVDRHLRAAILASLALFASVALLFAWLGHLPVVVHAGVALWGLSFGGAATFLQTALADAAGHGADTALSINVVAWNSAIAGGGVLGGILLDRWGAPSFAWALLVLLALAFAIAWSARAHGFRPGPRAVATSAHSAAAGH